MDGPPTLATLPAEMQKAVADALHYEDIIPFRQVSRDMYAASEDAFLTLYFGERHYIFSRFGLTRLAEMTSHQQLVKGLWNIRIIVLDPKGFTASSKTSAVESREPIDSDSNDENDGDPDTAWAKEVARLDAAWEDQMADLTRDDLDIHLLALTMRNLQASDRDVDICITGSIGDDVAPGMATGSYDLIEVLDLEEVPVSYRRTPFVGDCDRAMSSLFKAASRTGFSFSHLELCEDPDRGTFRPQALESLSSLELRGLCRSWATLSSLMIGFANGRERWFINKDRGLSTLIASATNITMLFLYNDGMNDEDWEGPGAFDDPNPLSWLGTAFAAHRLRHLRLGGFHARADQFAKILRDHRQTLKQVELLGVEIQGLECWSSVLHVVLTDLNLDDINVCGLMRCADMYEEIILPDGRDRLSVEEPDQIKALLSQMLTEGVKYKALGS